MTSPTGNRNSRQAFTLIEILVSVTILAVGIVAIMGAFNVCLSALSASSERMRATLLMRETISGMEQDGFRGASDGKFADGNEGFSWRIDVHPAWRRSGAEVSEVVVSVWREDENAAYSLATYARAPFRR